MAKKRKLTLIALLSVIVLAAVVVSALLLIPKKEESIYTTVYKKDPSMLQSAVISNEYGEYEIYCQDGQMYIPSLDGCVLSNDAISTAQEYLTSLKANNVVADNQENGSEFGLDKAIAKAVINYTDNTSVAITVHSYSETANEYYFTVEGDERIFSATKTPLKYFLDSNLQFISLSITPFGSANSFDTLEYIEFQNQNGTFILQSINPFVQDGYGNLFKHSLSGSVQGYVDTGFLYNKMPDLTEVTASSAYAVNPTQEQLKECGLDSPSSYLLLKDGDNSVKIQIGGFSGTDGRYAMLEGGNVIYIMASSVVTWEDYTAGDIATPFVAAPTMDTVSAISIQVEGDSYQISINGEDVICNGQKIDYSIFKNAYKLFCSVQRNGEPQTKTDESPVATIQFTKKDNSTTTVQLFRTESRNLLVTVDGVETCTCRNAFLSALKTGIDHMLSGEQVVYEW